MDVDGSHESRVAETRSGFELAWYPGNNLLFTSDEGGKTNIFITDPLGTNVTSVISAEARLATLDLFAPIDEAVRARGLRQVYLQAHPSPAGTEIAARRIAEALGQLKMLPAP